MINVYKVSDVEQCAIFPLDCLSIQRTEYNTFKEFCFSSQHLDGIVLVH